jgi:toxin ParE1/3/4
MAHRVSRQARADLDAIWEYVVTESGNEAAADRLIDSLTARFHLLTSHPRIGRARDDDLGAGLRSFPVGNYVIVYQIVGGDVQILRIAHGRRNLAALFGH